MITNICLLLEALSVVLCVHYLYGEKFKLDIATVSYLSIYMIIMAGINYYDLPQIYTMVTYAIMLLYCGIRFGFKLKAIIVNNILYMAIISSMQLIVLLLYYFIFKVQLFVNMRLLIVNSIAFAIVLFILPKCKLSKISNYLQDNGRIYILALCISVTVAGYCLIQYKRIDTVGLLQGVLMFISIMFICFLLVQLGKYRIKSMEIETELKMHKLYADSFQNLIENIRMRQHEFDNHIQTIYDQHYAYSTYEDLVNAQKEYYEAVAKDNRYNKLLTAGNPVLIGFLYGQFVEAERHNIEVSYKVTIGEFNVGVPIYKIIEILGNFIKNAIEALESSEMEKRLHVSVIETDGEFEMEIRNVSRHFTYDETGMFFKKGYSEKGTNRGLGLYNVKNICSEYMLNLYCNNKTIDNCNWLYFLVNNKKVKISN